MVKYEVKMTSIGKDAPAYLESNSAFILMNEKIRPTLTDMVVEHTVGEVVADIAVGDKLKVGKSEFEVRGRSLHHSRKRRGNHARSNRCQRCASAASALRQRDSILHRRINFKVVIKKAPSNLEGAFLYFQSDINLQSAECL